MRCNNCGWDNDPGSGVCIKCGHPLQTEDAGLQDPYQNVNVPKYNNGNGEPSPRPTVINRPQAEPTPRPTRIVNSGDFSNMPQQDPIPPINQAAPINATVAQAPHNCPHCGYPVVGEFTSCPNCGASIAPAPTTIQHPAQSRATVVVTEEAPQPVPVAAPIPHPQKEDLATFGFDEKVKCDKCGEEVSIDFSFCPKCGERIHLPTVRAIRHKPTPAPEPPKPTCHLTIIPEEGEEAEAPKNTYEGESIILNRENTEADNRTITSKEQAELINEDGQWYILNHSELGSTYIEANRKIALEPGDVIVLGDRRFKFETE